MFLTKVERRLCFHPLHHLCWLEGNANYDHTNLVPTHAWEWPCSWTDQNSESHAALVAAKNGGSFKVPLPILAPNDCPITKNWTSNRLPVESPSLHGNAPVGIILVQKKRHFNALSGTYIINESHVVIHCDGGIFAAKFFCGTGVIAGPEGFRSFSTLRDQEASGWWFGARCLGYLSDGLLLRGLNPDSRAGPKAHFVWTALAVKPAKHVQLLKQAGGHRWGKLLCCVKGFRGSKIDPVSRSGTGQWSPTSSLATTTSHCLAF